MHCLQSIYSAHLCTAEGLFADATNDSSAVHSCLTHLPAPQAGSPDLHRSGPTTQLLHYAAENLTAIAPEAPQMFPPDIREV